MPPTWPDADAARDGGATVVGVDVGGTKVLAGLVGDDGSAHHVVRTSTPGRDAPGELVEEAVVSAVLTCTGGTVPDAVGLAAAGFVDAAGERVVFAPHLPWRGEDVRRRLADRLGTPVLLDNDATCAAHAEATYGAGRFARSMLLVTLGTGIGGGLVLDGRVWRGENGMAGEFGHMQVVPDGAPCECGRRGCWEQYCSGNALVRDVRARLGSEPTVLAERCDGDPGRLTGLMVSVAAADGDPLAQQAFGRVGEWLGTGLAGLVAAFDPAVVVVGGGVATAGGLLLDPARDVLARSLVGTGHRAVPSVLPAALGPEAGLVGAASLARDRYGRR